MRKVPLGTGLLTFMIMQTAAGADTWALMIQNCPRLDINYQISVPEPQVVYEPAVDIRRKSGMGMDVLGLYQRTVGVGMTAQGCRAQATVALQSVISIALEARNNPCVGKEVMAHERTHFAIQKQAFDAAVREIMMQDLGTACLHTQGCSFDVLQRTVQNGLYTNMERLAEPGHAQLDSAESIARTQNACPREFDFAGDVVTQGKWFQ